MGVSLGQLAAANPLGGLRQIANIVSIESLVRIGDDAHLLPWVAETWVLSADKRSVVLKLRTDIKFHDGMPVTASVVKAVIDRTMLRWLGPAAADLESVTAKSDTEVEVRFRHPSPMLLESLEVQIQRPEAPAIGTGPFKLSGTQIVANEDYYLGPPMIKTISVDPYPSVRAAWADMLRTRLDMLWEVGVDALDSLQGSNDIRVFSFVRRYQYEIAFGPANPALAPAGVRRAISNAIDRDVVVREALAGHGLPSTGAVWPQHWALEAAAIHPLFAPNNVPRQPLGIKFTCMVAPDYERLAMSVKRQLEPIGVDMELQERSPDEIFSAVASGAFDAALIDVVSGPSFFRVYEWWHTGGYLNPGSLGNVKYDRALDGVRQAKTEAEYRTAILNVQHLFSDDPPAVFLAWSERARAVSKRFVVPAITPGRDPIATLRLWRPAANGSAVASRN